LNQGRPNRRPQNKGFTLFEVLLVLGILTVLSGLVLPSVNQWRSGLPLQRAETEFRDRLIAARTAAITSGEPHGVQVQFGQTAYRALKRSGQSWASEERRLPDGVRFVAGQGRAGWSPPIIFTPDGVGPDLSVSLIDEQQVTSVLVLDRLTGTVRIDSRS
jgi:prepilin-type N-terminal cleavage/methylation domain-containing protein